MSEIDDNFENYLNDLVIRKAITFDIFQIGELFSNLSDKCKKYFKNDDVKGLKDIRNFIAHGYVYIENIELWKCIHEELPRIVATLNNIKETIMFSRQEV